MWPVATNVTDLELLANLPTQTQVDQSALALKLIINSLKSQIQFTDFIVALKYNFIKSPYFSYTSYGGLRWIKAQAD